MLVLRVMRNTGELYRGEVVAAEALEKTHRFLVEDDFLFIPLSRKLSETELVEMDHRVSLKLVDISVHFPVETHPTAPVSLQCIGDTEDIKDTSAPSASSLRTCRTGREVSCQVKTHLLACLTCQVVTLQEKTQKDICCKLVERDMPKRQFIRKGPHERIMERLIERSFPEHLLTLVPKKWERFGDILVLRTHERLKEYEKVMADAFMRVLGVVSVYADERGIEGELRVPGLRHIAGTRRTTTHIENGIEYNFDVTRIMFSSGNIDERIRFSRIDAAGEVVVDMFAGIGYFTLPLAVYGKPARVYAIEKNPESYRFLEKNIIANGAEDVVIPVQGDNREVGPTGVARRVIMGYLPTPRKFLPRAFDFLGCEGGIIHYHYTCRKNEIHTLAEDHFNYVTSTKKRDFRIDTIKVIKSYAPMVYHCVADVSVLSNVSGTA